MGRTAFWLLLPQLCTALLPPLALHGVGRASARQYSPVAEIDARRLRVAISAGDRRVWQSRKLGSIDALQIATAPVDDATADACTIEVRAIGLNYADVFQVLGLYSASNEVLAAAAPSTGFVPGLEFAGIVEVVGPEAQFKPGDRVFGFTRFGAYTDRITQRATFLRKIPDNWSFAEAASVMVQGMTAYYGLMELGNAKKGSRVLVESAAGGVGLQTLEICEKLGCPACAVVGSEAKADVVRARFPDVESVVVRGSAPDAAYRAALDSFGAIDVVMESLGGPWFDEALTRLAPRGRLIHFGATAAYGAARSGPLKWPGLVAAYLRRPRVDPGELTSTNRAVFGFNLIWLTEQEEYLAEVLDGMAAVLLDRPPLVGRTFAFDALPDALRHLQSGSSTGKVVVVVEDN